MDARDIFAAHLARHILLRARDEDIPALAPIGTVNRSAASVSTSFFQRLGEKLSLSQFTHFSREWLPFSDG
ncbi:hypothetical protein WP12_10755 [Sphingomonas sp. SRS2]|nr:hypothetical protein WP12_10755 [Sphingomonas sp. SRS2]